MNNFSFVLIFGLALIAYAEINFECDFQDDLCGCDLSSNGQFKWRRGKGGTPSILTGPNQDRFETKTGNYLYTEATGAKEGDTATLTTRTIQAGTGKHCLQFFYYDYGEDMGSLDVKVQGEPQNLFSVSGGQEPGWREINKNIGKTSPFKVTFKATRGSGPKGDMAIDGIKISDGDCQTDVIRVLPVPPTPEPTKPPPVVPVEYQPRPIYGVAPVGCFRDKGQRAFPEVHRMPRDLDYNTFADRVRECRDKVDSKGEDYEYFGVEFYGFECFYGSKKDARTQPYKYGYHDNCVKNMMGASWSFYVYKSCKGEKSCTVEKPPTPQERVAQIEGVRQINCTGDTGRRAFPERKNFAWARDNMDLMLNNVEACRDEVRSKGGLAAGYKYFGLQYWKECFYGKESDSRTQPWRHPVAPNRKCNQVTGEGWTMMIYELLS